MSIQLAMRSGSYADYPMRSSFVQAGARAGVEEDIVNIAARAKIEQLKGYSHSEWGSNRLQYLLRETQKFASSDQVRLIFNEVARCAGQGRCNSVNDIPEAIKNTAMSQARFLVPLFNSIVFKCPEARKFVEDNFGGRRSNIDPTDFSHLQIISKWLEDHQDILMPIEQLEVAACTLSEIDLPHELHFLKNLKKLVIYVNDQKTVRLGCLPSEVMRMTELSLSLRGHLLEVSRESARDYAYHLHSMRMDREFDKTAYDALKRLTIVLQSRHSFTYVDIAYAILEAIILVPYQYIRALIIWNIDNRNHPSRPTPLF